MVEAWLNVDMFVYVEWSLSLRWFESLKLQHALSHLGAEYEIVFLMKFRWHDNLYIYILFVSNIKGGFAYVYVVQDIQTGTKYALKRLLGNDKQACNNIIREINIHKQVSSHPNIVRYVAASFIDRTNEQGSAEYLLVSELCKGKIFSSSQSTGHTLNKLNDIPYG